MAEFGKKVKEMDITLATIYRAFYLAAPFHTNLIRKPIINLYEQTTNSGRTVRNSRAYRRRGGESNVTERYLMDFEKAWYSIYIRSGDISKVLYSFERTKVAAKSLYAMTKQAEAGKGKYACITFLKKSFYSTLGAVCCQLIKQRLQLDVKVTVGPSTITFEGPGKKSFLIEYATQTGKSDPYANPSNMLKAVYKAFTE